MALAHPKQRGLRLQTPVSVVERHGLDDLQKAFRPFTAPGSISSHLDFILPLATGGLRRESEVGSAQPLLTEIQTIHGFTLTHIPLSSKSYGDGEVVKWQVWPWKLKSQTHTRRCRSSGDWGRTGFRQPP